MKLTKRITLLIIGAVAIPSIMFATMFFSYMERTMIDNAQEDLRHTLEQEQLGVVKNIESIHLTERIFKSERELIAFLQRVKRDEVESREAVTFFKESLKDLENIVNTNPYLYQTRIYLEANNVQEMMPIIYHNTRMHKLAWYDDAVLNNWAYGYQDTLFEGFGQSEALVGYITPIRATYTNEVLGTMEITMRMETMFPILYEDKDNQWAWFIDHQGKSYASESSTPVPEAIEPIKFTTEQHIYYQKIQDRDYIIGMRAIDDVDGKLVVVRDVSEDIGGIETIKLFFFVIVGVFFSVFIVAIRYITAKIFRKFYDILFSIQEIQKGNLNLVIDTQGDDEVSELGLQINKMSQQIKELMEENVHRQILIKNSEIKALQNQINAHFIYNVLESIKMMAEIDEKYEISDATTALGRLLRYTMKWTSSNSYLEEEIEYIKNYLKLINLRFDYTIALSLNVPTKLLKQRVPKMTLQPIIENAIYHGIEDIAEDTILYIRGTIQGDNGIIEVTDTGKGMTQEEIDKLYAKLATSIEPSGGKGNGIGLKNVQDRLKMTFGEAYGLTVESKQDCYTKVRMTIPIIPEQKEGEKSDR